MSEQATPYQIIGGEQGIRKLVEHFYDHMDELDESKDVRAMHAKSLRISREKLFLFLSGWLGGPDLYIEKHGHPQLRRRHLPFAIDKQARDQWMLCMRKALNDMQLEESFKQKLEQAFMATADHMRNQSEHQEDGRLQIFPGANQ